MFENWSQKFFSGDKKRDAQTKCLPTNNIKEIADTSSKAASEYSEFTGGLPDDFWSILVHMPGVISAHNVDALRKTPLYQQLKQQHEARSSLNTATESEQQPLSKIKRTSDRRP